MFLPRFRIRTLMIAVAAVAGLCAVARKFPQTTIASVIFLVGVALSVHLRYVDSLRGHVPPDPPEPK
jgi:hypothetical protein